MWSLDIKSTLWCPQRCKKKRNPPSNITCSANPSFLCGDIRIKACVSVIVCICVWCPSGGLSHQPVAVLALLSPQNNQQRKTKTLFSRVCRAELRWVKSSGRDVVSCVRQSVHRKALSFLFVGITLLRSWGSSWMHYWKLHLVQMENHGKMSLIPPPRPDEMCYLSSIWPLDGRTANGEQPGSINWLCSARSSINSAPAWVSSGHPEEEACFGSL